MTTKYSDIIQIRGGKAAYNIEEEKSGEWSTFIPNEQFNQVLRTVQKSVRGNDIDYHKSFWIRGTYGTGKSHAVAVITHLLGDEVEFIQGWVDYEYGDPKFASIRNAIYSLRKEKRLLTVKLYGIEHITDTKDLALALQKAVKATLKAKKIDIHVPTDFESYIDHIRQNRELWEGWIAEKVALNSIVSNTDQLIDNLEDNDLGTLHSITDTLREMGFSLNLGNDNVRQWLIEVQDKLAELGTYNGLLLVWDEFTDVMSSPAGLPVLKELQGIVEKFANEENNSYLFLISHPSAFDKMNPDQMKQTYGRYHVMTYNMEAISAFKIMSRKFEIVDSTRHDKLCKSFYAQNPNLLTLYTQTSNDQQSSQEDLYNLFPLHPGTANLATHYATVVGSSSRSVFEFLGQNEAIEAFLNNSEHYLNRDTITADYLWDYVLKALQEDITNYGAVTERYNSYRTQVAYKGKAYSAVFKSILLLNAFNNVSGDNNKGLITPSEDNIKALFQGSCYEGEVDEVLRWFNDEGIIQRAPGGLYSVQFSALPSGEIEEKKKEMRNVAFRFTHLVVNFGDVASLTFKGRFMQKVIRPYSFKFYSDVENDSSLRSQIKNGKKETKPSSLFFALLVARNYQELATLRAFAEKCTQDEDDKDLKDIIFIVFDEVLTDAGYERFIEYQANYACASSHGFVDQQKVHRDHAVGMVKDWMDKMQRGNATIYLNGTEKMPIAVKHLSSVVNTGVAPTIFPYGPDACDTLRQKARGTFWNQQNSKEMVRTFLFATSKAEIQSVTAQMRPIQYLIQDCLDDNLKWKDDVPEEHPFKKVCDKVNSIINHANKSLPFNFNEKFGVLTQPPYGLYGSFGAMATMAFALRGWENKIFDLQGKPRDKNAMIDDIVWLFKVWDDNKSANKLTFKFQTPEEGKLCKALTSLFKLNDKSNEYNDISSLKDARYAITGVFLRKKGCPLWAIKYASTASISHLPVTITISDEIKKLTDNIVEICQEREMRNPALVNETLALIDKWRIEYKNILNVDTVFQDGFKNFLMQIELIDLKEEEIPEVRRYVEQNLQSTVGYWTEQEVSEKAKNWRLVKTQQASAQTTVPVQPAQPAQPAVTTYPAPPTQREGMAHSPQPTTDPDRLDRKRLMAKERIRRLNTLQEAVDMLNKLMADGNEWLYDRINS